jgi:hypothetical protein
MRRPSSIFTGVGIIRTPRVSSSVGYVTEAMERGLGKKVKVELLESLKMGGTDCRFRVDVSS